MELEKTLLEEAEHDKSEYQKKDFSNRNTVLFLKHFLSRHKLFQENVELFNRYFQSVYSVNPSAKSEVWNPKHDQGPTLTKFSISKKSTRLFLAKADSTNSRRPEAIIPVFFSKVG